MCCSVQKKCMGFSMAILKCHSNKTRKKRKRHTIEKRKKKSKDGPRITKLGVQSWATYRCDPKYGRVLNLWGADRVSSSGKKIIQMEIGFHPREKTLHKWKPRTGDRKKHVSQSPRKMLEHPPHTPPSTINRPNCTPGRDGNCMLHSSTLLPLVILIKTQ